MATTKVTINGVVIETDDPTIIATIIEKVAKKTEKEKPDDKALLCPYCRKAPIARRGAKTCGAKRCKNRSIAKSMKGRKWSDEQRKRHSDAIRARNERNLLDKLFPES